MSNEIVTEAVFPYPNAESRRKEFLELVAELNLTPSELAMQMRELGDFRSQATIVRTLQRVFSERSEVRTAVSGELFAIVKILANRQRRLKRQNRSITWKRANSGATCATVRGYSISLYENNNGLWQVHVVHNESNYSHPFPRYPSNLEAAKLKALACIEDAEGVLEACTEPVSQIWQNLEKPTCHGI